MAFAQLTGVSLAYGDRDLLSGINFNLDGESRVALAGANGSGKSTLMKIMAGAIRADSGEVVVQKSARIAYLPQSGIGYGGATLLAEAERAFDWLHRLVADKEEIEQRLATVTEEDRQTQALLLRRHELEERLLESGYYERRERIMSVLAGLGFAEEDVERDAGEFSGGWQMRIALAKVLLERPELLLLDEPTNYLDLEARSWLEEYLTSLHGGYLIVSHDRYFLDVTVDQVAELWNGRLRVFRGNYSDYERRRGEELAEIVARYEQQQAEIAKTEEFINRFRYNSSKAQLVQSRIKQLERIERIEIPEGMKRIHFSFPPPPHSGRQMLALTGVTKGYGERRVLDDLSLNVRRGEKVVIVGRNGAGKSTLMRVIAGIDESFGGERRLGTGVTIGYFSQDMEAHLDLSKQVIEEIESAAPTSLYPRLRDLLGAFLFRGDDVFKPISVLSGGEKSRVALLKLLLHPANLLVLDEPTNHLDLMSKDVLLEALQRFDGSLLFVSHDRYFIDKLATVVFELAPDPSDPLAPSRARLYPGDYEYYRWRLAHGDAEPAPSRAADADREVEREVERAQPTGSAFHDAGHRRDAGHRGNGGTAPGGEAPGGSGLPRTLLVKRDHRRLEREQASLLEQIEALEREHARISEEMARPDVYVDGMKIKALTAALTENERSQAGALERWEEIERALGAGGSTP